MKSVWLIPLHFLCIALPLHFHSFGLLVFQLSAAVYITLHSFLFLWQVGFQHDTVWKKDDCFTSVNFPPAWERGPVIHCACTFLACKVFYAVWSFCDNSSLQFSLSSYFLQSSINCSMLSQSYFSLHLVSSSLQLFSVQCAWIPTVGLSGLVC